MPLTIDPPKRTSGPGSAPGTKRRRIRGRRPQICTTKAPLYPKADSKNPSTDTVSFIGQELVDLTSRSKLSETAVRDNSIWEKSVATSKATSSPTVCLDTRFVDTSGGRNAGLQIVDGFKSFLRSLDTRGDDWNVVATTSNKSVANEKATTELRYFQSSQSLEEVHTELQGVALSSSRCRSGDEVLISHELSADASWKLFTRMSKSFTSLLSP